VSSYLILLSYWGIGMKMATGNDYTGLSLRETEVLNYVAQGRANADISAVMGISERTVEKHLERVYKKLGVETRTAAVIHCFNKREKVLVP